LTFAAERFYRLTLSLARAILSLVKTIVLTPAAAKQLDALPLAAQTTIEKALNRFAVDGQGDVKKLQGRDGFRLQVGEYRVLFDETATIILAFSIDRRQTHTYS
jgi:mRNA interferase RelE/StbE